ncbi:hypothetical protein L208DRAFT_1273281 [Tricholoma matsutake]|nr:hypothetical protein L208DRAFT_1273281 [Tricholoma matsutake 945]
MDDGRKLIALTTDNPTVMQAYRRKFQVSYYWILTFACFLHGLNMIIGEIVAYPEMKKIVTKSMKIITFFSSSHYWGGQLKNEAQKAKINHGLKKNRETHWYVLILMALSVKSHWYVSCGCQHDSI